MHQPFESKIYELLFFVISVLNRRMNRKRSILIWWCRTPNLPHVRANVRTLFIYGMRSPTTHSSVFGMSQPNGVLSVVYGISNCTNVEITIHRVHRINETRARIQNEFTGKVIIFWIDQLNNKQLEIVMCNFFFTV